MKHNPNSRRPKVRVTIKLDYEWDSDLIEWLTGLPGGYRSQAIRDALRQILRAPDDTNALREVVAEELAKVLAAGQRIPTKSPDITEETEVNVVEAEFGAKLDRMLGGLGKSNPKSEIDG